MTGEEHIPRIGEKHRLHGTALIISGCLLAYALYRGWHLQFEELSLALICIVLAVRPALTWLKHQPIPFPAFEVFMLTCIPSYALQLVSEHEGLAIYSDTVIERAMIAVILFQISAQLTYSRVTATAKRTPFWNAVLFERDISHWLLPGLWLNVAYIWVSTFTTWLPGDIDSILRAVFFGIATACTFLLGRSWGAGELSQSMRLNVLFVLIAAAILQITSLYLISTIAAVMVLFLAYISAGRKIPVLAMILVFAVLSVLHNGKGPMRVKHWAIDAKPVEFADLPEFYSEWLGYGLQPFRDDSGEVKKRELLERASLLHIMCLVVDATDRGLPFMGGETYGYVAPMLVPRFFWPGKPSGQVTTSRLAIHFGLQTEESAKSTSIGFGVLAEAFANFGYWGIIALGIVIGWANKVVAMWTKSSPLLSNGGLLMILLMAWSIQVEMPMSSWVSSFYQAAICVLGIPYAISRFFR